MPLALLPGSSVDTAVSALTHQLNSLTTVSQGNKYEVHSQYLRWATQAANTFRDLMSPDDVDHLVLTRRHWVLCGVDPAANEAILSLVNTEIGERREAINKAVTDLTLASNRWNAHRGALLVPDTNVLLHHKLPLEQIDWRSMADDNQYRLITSA